MDTGKQTYHLQFLSFFVFFSRKKTYTHFEVFDINCVFNEFEIIIAFVKQTFYDSGNFAATPSGFEGEKSVWKNPNYQNLNTINSIQLVFSRK